MMYSPDVEAAMRSAAPLAWEWKEERTVFGLLRVSPDVFHLFLHVGLPEKLLKRRFEVVRTGRQLVRYALDNARVVSSSFDPDKHGAIRLGTAIGLRDTGIRLPDGRHVMAATRQP